MSNNQQRTSLGLDDEIPIDIEQVASIRNRPAPTAEQQKAMMKAGERQGFVSRQPVTKKPRKRSPYVVQKNIKMRIGMAELLSGLTASISAASDQVTLEMAIMALIEQKGLAALLAEYQELTNPDYG